MTFKKSIQHSIHSLFQSFSNRRWVVAFVALVGLGSLVGITWGQSGVQTKAHHETPDRQGAVEEQFTTEDLIGFMALTVDGEVVRLGLENGARPLALAFLNDDCTISRRYVQRLNALGKEAEELGVDLLAVLSNPHISVQQGSEFREEYGLEIPLLYDANGEIGRQVAPTVVPSAFVLDLNGRITYRGRIDDRFPSLTKVLPEARNHDLLRAMEAVAAGEVVGQTMTQAVGCVYTGWPESDEAPTYTAQVAPILNANCVECHREGGVAPFALDSYKAAKRWSRMISMVTDEGLMPPWRAERGFGHFREERFLTTSQVQTLASWAQAKAPYGDDEDLLPTPTFDTEAWKLGPPDLVLTMPEAFEVPADGEDIYRYFVLPMELVEDAVIVAMDFRPGDPSVVHHCNYFVDYSGRARAMDREDPGLGFSVFGTGGFMSYDGPNALAGWAPGVAPYQLPEGRGFDLPRGGDIVLEVHYHLSGKATRDQSSIAFYFAKGPVKRGVSALFIGTQDVDIPAGESNYWRKISMKVPAGFRLVDIGPHMHYLGREVRAWARLPDGEQLPLLHVTDWDLRWQGTYTFRQPLHIPAGSTLEAHFRFDNSADHPTNPNSPPQRVKWGWGSDEEMAELYMTVIPDNPKDEGKLQRAARKSWWRSADLKAPKQAWAVSRGAGTGAGQRP